MGFTVKYHVVVYGFGDSPLWSYLATSLADAFDYRAEILDAFGEAEIKYRYVQTK